MGGLRRSRARQGHGRASENSTGKRCARSLQEGTPVGG
jgi:hypothetical protein